MDTISALQRQFPLSPKKFWKKIINQIVGMVFFDAVLGVGVGFGIYFVWVAVTGTPNSDISYTPMILGIVLAAILIFVLHFALYSWYVKTYIKRYYYDGEEHFITIKKGVFAPAEIHVQWQKIQDVYVDQDILDRIMGLYDVHIASATATSGIEAHIDGVDKRSADGLKQFLLSKVAGSGMRNNSATPANQGEKVVAQAAAQSSSPVSKIKLSERLSSQEYPLSSKWTSVELIKKILGSFVISLFVIIIIVTKFQEISVADDLAYLILGWLGLAVLTTIVRIIALLLWKKNYAFSFDADNIYFKQGIISISEKHMPYSSIQDVAVQQSFIDRMFGLAKVRIENAATQTIQTKNGAVPIFSGVLIQGLSLADANKITGILKTNVLGKNSTQYGL